MPDISTAFHRGLAAAGVFMGMQVGLATAGEPPPRNGDWNFHVLLDGEPIGEHRFSVRTHGDERDVLSEANFAVKLLGLTAYRYRHQAMERWQGNCLTALSSSTDDDGKTTNVDATAGRPPIDGCVMSFAYWNPAIRTQSTLLNAQTGKLEEVRIEPLAGKSIEVNGRPCPATGFRISGPTRPVDVWYSAEGQWIGLDSIVGRSRKLSYRLP